MYDALEFNNKREKKEQGLENPYVKNTFQIVANVIIPRSLVLAEQYGQIQYYGALDSYTDEFMIISLDSLAIPLSQAVAEMINKAAEQYAENIPNGLMSLMVHDNTMDSQDQELYPALLSLNRLALMGYYSEWSGYGSTRLNIPTQRVLEYHPISWEQIGYPGPARGYRYYGGPPVT